MVDEIFVILWLKPLKSCYTVWEHDPAFANQISAGKEEEAYVLENISFLFALWSSPSFHLTEPAPNALFPHNLTTCR